MYKDVFESVFPCKSNKQNRKYITREPWVTPSLLVSSRSKTTLFKNKLKNPSSYNIERYKTYINIYSKLKRKIKIDYYKNLLNENKFNIKKPGQFSNKQLVNEMINQVFHIHFV